MNSGKRSIRPLSKLAPDQQMLGNLGAQNPTRTKLRDNSSTKLTEAVLSGVEFRKRSIIGIMATSPEGAIGKDNDLLWNYPDELAYFKQTTKGQVIIMGRKTFAAMPASVFVDRTAIVFSKQHPLTTSINHQAVSNLNDFGEIAKSLNNQQFFMVGGAQIAHLFLKENLLTEFLLTKINKSYLGDSYLDLNFLQIGPKKSLIQIKIIQL